jgi:hypothetical protein
METPPPSWRSLNTLSGKGFFAHDEILVMDNTAIHTGAEASIVEDLLWDIVVDGEPLHVLVVYLPARAPN